MGKTAPTYPLRLLVPNRAAGLLRAGWVGAPVTFCDGCNLNTCDKLRAVTLMQLLVPSGGMRGGPPVTFFGGYDLNILHGEMCRQLLLLANLTALPCPTVAATI